MRDKFSDILVFLAILLVLAAYFATGWMAAPEKGRLLTCGLPAMIVILLCCVPLYFIHQWMLPGISFVTVLFYAFLAAANPTTFCLSPFHGVAVLLAVSLYCYLCFSALRPALKYVTGMWLTLGIAVQILPSLLWLTPVLLLSSIDKAMEKGKYCFTALLGLLLPPFAWMAVRYLSSGITPAGDYLPRLWSEMTALHLPSPNLSAATLCRIGFTALMVITAILRIIPRLSRYKTAQYHAILRLVLMTLCLSVYGFLFLNYPALPAGLLVLLPAAPLLGVFVYDTLSRKAAQTWIAILVLLLAAERISLFVNL